MLPLCVLQFPCFFSTTFSPTLRIDALLVQKGYARSRSQAKQLIEQGCVSFSYNNSPKQSCSIPSMKFENPDFLQIFLSSGENSLNSDQDPWVLPFELYHSSRGAAKFDYFINNSNVDLSKYQQWADIGAGFGGFTSSLLLNYENSIENVHCIDSGIAQFDSHLKLQFPSKIIDYSPISIQSNTLNIPSIDAAVVDLSFRSTATALPQISNLFRELSKPAKPLLIILVKPQFEVHNSFLSQGNVIGSGTYSDHYKIVKALNNDESVDFPMAFPKNIDIRPNNSLGLLYSLSETKVGLVNQLGMGPNISGLTTIITHLLYLNQWNIIDILPVPSHTRQDKFKNVKRNLEWFVVAEKIA